MTIRRIALLAALAALVVATRVPFMTHQLWAWDSVLYARALERGFHVDFELSDQRPQPPGYILYVALASLFRAAGTDSNTALVLVSVLASAVGAAAIYALARRFARAAPAMIAAAAYALNPLVWTYSEVAYPYALLGALAVVLAAVFWSARAARGAREPLVASLAFGLLAGFRQDLLLLAGPLWLWTIWPRSWRVRAAATAAVTLGIAVWLVPTALLSEGFAAYVDALARQADYVGASYSVTAQGAEALLYNLRFTGYSLSWALLGLGVVLLGLGLGLALPWLQHRHLPRSLDGPRAFFVAWLAPGVAFYVAIHIGESGYVLSIVPGLYVLTAALADGFANGLHARAGRAWRAGMASLALAPALVFLFAPVRFSAAALHQHDVGLHARVAYVRANFPAAGTAVLAREDFLLVRYYLPEYRAWYYDPAPHDGPTMHRKRPMRTNAIVVFTEGLRPRADLDARYVRIDDGIVIAYVTIEPGAVLELYGERYTVRDRP